MSVEWFLILLVALAVAAAVVLYRKRQQQKEEEGVEIGLYDRVPPGDVGGSAGDDTVTYEDGVFKLVEQGQATFVAEGSTGTAPQGSARYADYESSDGRLLSFEQFGQQWEVSVGTHVLPAALDIFPVSD